MQLRARFLTINWRSGRSRICRVRSIDRMWFGRARRLSPVACCRSGLARFRVREISCVRPNGSGGALKFLHANLIPKTSPSSGLRKRTDWGSAGERYGAPVRRSGTTGRRPGGLRCHATVVLWDSRCADEQRRDRDPTRAETIARQSTIPEKVASTRVSLRTGSSPRCHCSCSESPGMTLRRQQRRPQGNPRSLGSQLKGNPPKCDTLE